MHNTEDGRKYTELDFGKLKIISLRSLLNHVTNETSLNKLREVLFQFKCNKKDLDEEDFLHNKAITFEKTKKARTYLVINNSQIVAFFSLSFKSIDLQSFSKSKIKELTAGETDATTYSAFLIGHIAKSDDIKQPMGDYLLDMAFDLLESAQEIIGGRLVYLDCKDKPKIKKLYENYGFKYFNTSEKTKLLQYYIKI